MAGTLRVAPPASRSGNVIRDSALGRVPETVDALAALSAAVWSDSGLPPSILELLRLRNANAVNCTICKSVRYDVARADGLTEERVQRLAANDLAEGFGPRERVAIAFADAYLGNPARIDAATREAIRAQFTAAEIAAMTIALVTSRPRALRSASAACPRRCR